MINPSSQAQKQLYQFLADAHERTAHTQNPDDPQAITIQAIELNRLSHY